MSTQNPFDGPPFTHHTHRMIDEIGLIDTGVRDDNLRSDKHTVSTRSATEDETVSILGVMRDLESDFEVKADPVESALTEELNRVFAQPKPVIIAAKSGGANTGVKDLNKPANRQQRRQEAAFAKKVNAKCTELLTWLMTFRDKLLKFLEDGRLALDVYSIRLKDKLEQLDKEWLRFLHEIATPEGVEELRQRFLIRADEIFTQLQRPTQ